MVAACTAAPFTRLAPSPTQLACSGKGIFRVELPKQRPDGLDRRLQDAKHRKGMHHEPGSDLPCPTKMHINQAMHNTA